MTKEVVPIDQQLREIIQFNKDKYGEGSLNPKMSNDCNLFFFKGKPEPYGYMTNVDYGLNFYANGPRDKQFGEYITTQNIESKKKIFLTFNKKNIF